MTFTDESIREAISIAIRTTGWTDPGAIHSWAAHHLAMSVAADGDVDAAERQVIDYAARKAVEAA